MNRENLEAKAEKTLRDTDTFRVPVAIHLVAQRLNLTMEAGALGEDVSGMLIIRGERGAIGYNSTHARVRQRFTISHEIAHFLLHAKRGGKPQLFIDRYVAFRRDANSSTGADRDVVEANQLGSALLMPRRLVQQEIRNNQLNLDDEDAISLLAKRFQVSNAAMTNRLANLGILR
jgi:Zn-dependent peptidase ImmA (M78 family)